VAHFRQHLFEPGAVTTRLKGNDYLAAKLFVEPTHIIMLMSQLPAMDLAIGHIAVTNRLFTRMKIHSDVYCHRAPPFVIHKSTGLEFTKTRGGRCLFHDIKGFPLVTSASGLYSVGLRAVRLDSACDY
jgi:hypothetical protein